MTLAPWSALDDLQHLHRAGLGADAAGDALLRELGALGQQADVHRADLDALAAGDALLLVDHVNALGVLGDGLLRAVAGALAALDAHEGGGLRPLHTDLNEGLVRVLGLEPRLRAGDGAAQAGLAVDVFLYGQFFHDVDLLWFIF